MHINRTNLDTVRGALFEILHNRQHIDLHDDDRAMLAKADTILQAIEGNTATDEQLDAARSEWTGTRSRDNLQIDDDAAISEADEGYWVQAWLWVQTPDADLAEAAEGDICTACERDSMDCSRDPCAAVIADRAA